MSEIVADKTPAIINKYDGKTIRVTCIGNDAYYGSRIYRISVEYSPNQLLEVNLIPLSDNGWIASSSFHWPSDPNEDVNLNPLQIKAIRKAIDIARDIEDKLHVDFEDEE